MTQMADQLKDWAIVGFTKYHGKAWWFDMFGGEMGKNHFEDGVPLELVIEKLEKLEPQIVDIAFDMSGNGLDYRKTKRKGVYIEEFDNLAYIGSDGYRIHPLADVFATALEISQQEGNGIKSLVAANGGALVSVQLSAPDLYETCGVKYSPSLFVATDHSGRMGTLAKGASGLSVCDNTQEMVINEKTANFFKVKHTKNSILAEGGFAFSQELSELAKKIGYNIEKLCSVKVTDAQFEAWLEQYFPLPKKRQNTGSTDDATQKDRALTIARNKRNEVRNMYRDDRRCAPWKGTAFGILQTANTYQQHEAPIRAATRLSRNTENFFSGKASTLDRIAMEHLTKVLEAA